jgi:hypothetical protein
MAATRLRFQLRRASLNALGRRSFSVGGEGGHDGNAAAVFDKQGEINFPGAEVRIGARGKAQASCQFSRQPEVRLLLWGFGRNGAWSVTLQGGVIIFFALNKLLTIQTAISAIQRMSCPVHSITSSSTSN